MVCVTSVNYHVLHNGDKLGPIQAGRGLKQGDPLSCTFLFYVQKLCPVLLVPWKAAVFYMVVSRVQKLGRVRYDLADS